MTNVEHEHAGNLATGQAPDDQAQGGATPNTTGPAPILDDEQLDPAEYARLLDIYDSSFRNIVEGEVVKGTVLKVTDTGTQWQYHERPDDTPVASLDQLGVRITGPAGDIVTPKPTDLDMEYDARGGDLGTAVATFDATAPGAYTVTATTTPAAGTSFAVGPSVADPLRTPLIGAAVVLGV